MNSFSRSAGMQWLHPSDISTLAYEMIEGPAALWHFTEGQDL